MEKNIVKYLNDFNISIIETQNQKNVIEGLRLIDQVLTPSLTSRGIELENYSKKLSENAYSLIILNENQSIVGMASAYINNIDTKIAYLIILGISEKYRGLHLGRYLLNIINQKANEKGMNKIKLEVRKNNHKAISIYKKEGYDIIGDASETSFYMLKNL